MHPYRRPSLSKETHIGIPILPYLRKSLEATLPLSGDPYRHIYLSVSKEISRGTPSSFKKLPNTSSLLKHVLKGIHIHPTLRKYLEASFPL